MYDAEVLSKFPVVQHFPFGSLFSWEHDLDARVPMATVHTSSQPSNQGMSTATSQPIQTSPPETRAPWPASKPDHRASNSDTQAPWAIKRSQPAAGMRPAEGRSKVPAESQSRPSPTEIIAKGEGRRMDAGVTSPTSYTKAPWAK